MTKTLDPMRSPILTVGRTGRSTLAARRLISSVRWRWERPPIVFDGEIRHWFRIRLALTRPYLGTARSMSKTLAVNRYSGGSSRIV